jgi:hypothetical protein
MVLLGDVGHVESRFGLFGAVLVLVLDLRQTYHRLINRFGRTQWYCKVMRLKWKLDSVRLEMVLFLTQSGHEKLNSRNRTELPDTRTEIPKPIGFGSEFGSSI